MRFTPVILATLGAFSLLALPTDPARADSTKANGLELSFGVGNTAIPGDNFSLTTYGLRYHRRFNERWGLELSGAIEEGISVDEALFLDLSARLTLSENEVLELFAYCGPGVVFYDRHLSFFDRQTESDERLTLHAGLGLNLDLGGRLFFRPDLRYRLHDDLGPWTDDDSLQATAAFGFRF